MLYRDLLLHLYQSKSFFVIITLTKYIFLLLQNLYKIKIIYTTQFFGKPTAS